MPPDSLSSDSRFRRWTRIILVVAAILRLSYLLWGDVLPVMWDARTYASAALGLISYIDAPSDPDDESVKAYDELTQSHIQGEQIDWLFYKPYTLAEARNAIFFGGPLYPACLAVIYIISPVADFTMARLFNILLDLVSCWLLIRIAKRLAGETAAYVTGALYAVYFPFIFCSSMLLLETPTTCLILAAIWLVVSAQGKVNASRSYFWAGICLGLLILVKPSAMLIFIPFAIAGIVWLRHQGGVTISVVRQVGTSLVLILLGWTVVASIRYGELTLRDPNYADANLRQSSSIKYDGYDLDEVEPDFWTKQTFGEATDDPVGYLGLLSRKVHRLWSRPYNDFDRAWVLPYQVSEWVHVMFIIGGIVGITILARRSLVVAAFPLAVILYYTVLHAFFHSIPRYNLSAMPMILLGAGFAGQVAWEGFQARRNVRPFGVGLSAIIAVMIFPALIPPALGNSILIIGAMLLVQILFVCSAVWLFLPKESAKHGERRVAVGSVAVIGFLIYMPFVLHTNPFAEFSTRINDSSMTCGVKIFAKNIDPVSEGEVLMLLIDMTSGPADDNAFRVTAGDQTLEFAQDKPPLSDLFYPKGTYATYARFEGLKKKEFRQWAIIPIDPSIVEGELIRQGYIDIQITATSAVPVVGGQFVIYGRSDVNNEGGSIPAVRHTSIERWVSEGDPRIPLERRFLSDSAISYYIRTGRAGANVGDAQAKTTTVEHGRYSIYLMHFKPDWSLTIY